MQSLLVIFGFGVGILVGLTGVGGGSLMTPLLILAAGTPPVIAVGTDLAYAAVTKTVGGWQHLRAGHVDLGVALWLAAGSVPGSLLGVWCARRMHAATGDGLEGPLLIAIGLAIAVAGVAVLARGLVEAGADAQRAPLGTRERSLSVGAGVVLGFILGLTSVGSGALIALVLILAFRLSPRRVVGTDVFHAAILLWVAATAHFAAGGVDVALMINLLLGSIPGVWIGARLVRRVAPSLLQPLIGVVLLAAALAILSKARAGTLAVALVAGCGVAALALLGGARHRRRRPLTLPSP